MRADIERPARRLDAADIARHARRLAEQHFDGHVRPASSWNSGSLTTSTPLSSISPMTANGQRSRAAIAANSSNADGLDREHIALLRLVAPDLHRRHAGLGARHRAQIDPRAAIAVRHRFGHRVRQTAGADVVNQGDGVLVAQLPTGVDHFLRAPLDLGIAALDRGEVEIGARGATAHRGSRAAAQTDQHGGAAEHDEFRADRHLALLDMLAADVAQAAGDHDGLVIAAHAVRSDRPPLLLESTEVAADRGTPELVVE